MRIKGKHIMVLLVLLMQVFFINASPIIQSDKQIDSILKDITNNVYENPDVSINDALKVFNNNTYSKKTRTRALMLTSLGYSSKRDYKKALEYIIKADEFSSDIDDRKLDLDILFMTGILYQQLKIFDKSIEFMDELEREALIYPYRDSISNRLANSYLVKGFIYKDNLNCDIALEFFDKALKEYERINSNFHNKSIAYYNRGNCYILLSDYENALTSFNTSIELAEKENASSLISFAQKGTAEVYTLQGKYQEAIELLLRAQEKSKSVGDLVLNLGIYKGLFENYLALNKWDDYQKYYDLYLKNQLDIKTSERESVSISIDKNSKHFDQSLKDLKQGIIKRVQVLILVLGIALLIVFWVFQKNKKAIKNLKSTIETMQNS